MYRRLYRQEGGGLGSLNPYDYMRQEVDKYVQDYNTGNQGEVAAKVMPKPVPQTDFRTFKGPRNPFPLLLDTFSKSLAGDDFVNRTPGMDRNLEDIIKKQNTGLEGKINYSDYGFPDFVAEAKKDNLPQRNIDELQNSPSTLAIPTTRKQFMDIINAGPDAITNALTLGRLGYTTDPTTGKVSFTSGEFDFPAEGTVMEPVGDWINQGGLKGFYNRIKSKITGEEINPDTQKPINIQPENVYNPNTVAALQYGDIEAQAEANRLRQPINPLDYQDEFNFRRKYLSDYIDSSQDKFGDEGKLSSYAFIPEVSPMYNATQETGLSYDPQRYSEFQKTLDASDRAWRYRNNPEQNATDFNLLQNYYQGQQ